MLKVSALQRVSDNSTTYAVHFEEDLIWPAACQVGMMQLADDNQCLGMQVALLLSTLQVVWSLPDQDETLCSPRVTSTAGLRARSPTVGNPNQLRPYSASRRSSTDRRTVWSSAEQTASLQVRVIPYTSSLAVQISERSTTS